MGLGSEWDFSPSSYMTGRRYRPTQLAGRSKRVTGQAKAGGEAHRVSTLPRVSPRGAVQPGEGIMWLASRRDSSRRLVSERQIAGGRDKREDHENGEQCQRETATHRSRSWD